MCSLNCCSPHHFRPAAAHAGALLEGAAVLFAQKRAGRYWLAAAAVFVSFAMFAVAGFAIAGRFRVVDGLAVVAGSLHGLLAGAALAGAGRAARVGLVAALTLAVVVTLAVVCLTSPLPDADPTVHLALWFGRAFIYAIALLWATAAHVAAGALVGGPAGGPEGERAADEDAGDESELAPLSVA